MDKILDVAKLSVIFEDGPILENIHFSLDPGESLAVIGPNGAGKSVLIRALLGMLPYKGTIKWAPGTRKGYVPQKIEADRHLPVNFKNLLAAKAAILHLAKKDVEEIEHAVGFDKKILETPVGHLSGGQYQRAIIGFALLGKPNVLLLDEPTASIDKPGEEQVYELIHRLQEEFHITVILVSHDLSFVYRYATKVLCLNHAGVCYGKPEDALTPEVLDQLYGPHKYVHHFYHQNER